MPSRRPEAPLVHAFPELEDVVRIAVPANPAILSDVGVKRAETVRAFLPDLLNTRAHGLYLRRRGRLGGVSGKDGGGHQGHGDHRPVMLAAITLSVQSGNGRAQSVRGNGSGGTLETGATIAAPGGCPPDSPSRLVTPRLVLC